MEVAVRLLLSGLDFGLVARVLGVLEHGEEIFRMDADGLSAFLAEAKGGDAEGLDAIGLDGAGWVDDVVELLHHFIYVVGIAVARDKARVENLQGTVEHERSGSTFWMASEVLLEYTQQCVALLAAEMTHLLAYDV